MMKLVVLALFLATAISEEAVAINCLTTDAEGKVVDQVCEDAANKKCRGPVFSFETGLAYKYGCGACTSGDATCADCDGDKCIEKQELGDDYMCADNLWVNDKFVAQDPLTTCKSLKDTVQNQCNKPGTAAGKDEDFTSSNKGCGPCDPAKVTAKMCEETNSAVSMTALLLPLVAALYALF